MSGGVRGARWTQIDANARANVPWSDAWRGSRCSMDTNRCHRASGCAMEARGMAIAVPDELKESVGPGSEGRAWQVCVRSAIFRQIIARADMPWSAVWRGSRRSMDTNRCHRASQCVLQARRMAIAVPDELQKIPNIGLCPKTDSGKTLSSLQNYFWEKVQYGSSSMIMK